MGGVEVLWLITWFRDGQDLSALIDDGVCGMEPGESKDNVFSATAHDVEKMFLGDLFNVGVQGAGMMYSGSKNCLQVCLFCIESS